MFKIAPVARGACADPKLDSESGPGHSATGSRRDAVVARAQKNRQQCINFTNYLSSPFILKLICLDCERQHCLHSNLHTNCNGTAFNRLFQAFASYAATPGTLDAEILWHNTSDSRQIARSC